MPIQFAVNFSYPAAELARSGAIEVDLMKCPAWPELVTEVQREFPVYVHFPLLVGSGAGEPIDAETRGPADWDKIERLMMQTGTPLVNAHLAPGARFYPGVPTDTTDPAHAELLVERSIADLRALTARYGADRVLVENDNDGGGRTMRPAIEPQVVRRVIEETGCGLLLDLSHARLAAWHLGLAPEAYLAQLPLDRIGEIHITGIHRLEGHWLELARQARMPPDLIERMTGRPIDHLPMTEADWAFFGWCVERMASGAWRKPWVVTFEYGGVSQLFEPFTDRSVLAEQVPRLGRLVRAANSGRR